MVSILFAGLSIFFIGIGAAVLYFKLKLMKNGIRTKGIVINNEEYIETILDSYNQLVHVIMYRPIIEFVTEDGKKILVTYDKGSNPAQYDIGEELGIIYPVTNPDKFLIDSKFEILSFPILLISLGIIFLIFSTIVLFIV